MKLGLASTKCGSSVGLARVETSTLSPPISLASEPRSEVVAMTASLAWAVGAGGGGGRERERGQRKKVQGGFHGRLQERLERTKICGRRAPRVGIRVAARRNVRQIGRAHV